jgi:hypothetical protein
MTPSYPTIQSGDAPHGGAKQARAHAASAVTAVTAVERRITAPEAQSPPCNLTAFYLSPTQNPCLYTAWY